MSDLATAFLSNRAASGGSSGGPRPVVQFMSLGGFNWQIFVQMPVPYDVMHTELYTAGSLHTTKRALNTRSLSFRASLTPGLTYTLTVSGVNARNDGPSTSQIGTFQAPVASPISGTAYPLIRWQDY